MCVTLRKIYNLSQPQTCSAFDGCQNFEATRVLKVLLDLEDRLLFHAKVSKIDNGPTLKQS